MQHEQYTNLTYKCIQYIVKSPSLFELLFSKQKSQRNANNKNDLYNHKKIEVDSVNY